MWARIKGWGRWLARHRTKMIGACGVGAGCVQNYLATNHIAVLPQKWHGILISAFGMIVFLVGLYNSLRMTMRGPE
jgi:hypothetical protein